MSTTCHGRSKYFKSLTQEAVPKENVNSGNEAKEKSEKTETTRNMIKRKEWEVEKESVSHGQSPAAPGG